MEAWLIGIVAAVVLTAIGAVWRKSRARHLYAAGLSWTPWGRQLARQALAIERFASDHATASYLRSMNWNPLREHVLYLLNGGGALARFDDAVKNMPEELRGAKPNGLPHTAWMLLELLRLAQWDILEFSRNSKHTSPKWPEG